MSQKLTDEQWEQRRYDIAKELVTAFFTFYEEWSYEDYAEFAVSLADALINKLKENQS